MTPTFFRCGRMVVLCCLIALLASCADQDAVEPLPADVDTGGGVADTGVADLADDADADWLDVEVEDTDPGEGVVDAGGCGVCGVSTPYCVESTMTCVACLDSADCPKAGDRCVEHACVPLAPCKTDKACTAAAGVCDVDAGVCVDCLADSDCGADERCAAKICIAKGAGCTSSKECFAAGLVCDKVVGFCVDCAGDEDCAPNRHCVQGLCLPDVCVAGAKVCTDLHTRAVCVASGASRTTSACGASEVCKDGSCLAIVCTPGALRCTGAAVEKCDALGVAWKVEATCPSTHICLEGACAALLCTPGATQCAGAAVLTCGPDGQGWETTACAAPTEDKAGESCTLEGGKAVCKPWVCKPNVALCSGSEAHLCLADGLGTILKETCATKPGSDLGFVCVQGACVPLACKAGATSCSGTAVLTCKDNGLGHDAVTCPVGKGCLLGACVPQTCAPNAALCEGKQATTCDAAGTSTKLVADCLAAGKTCSDGACVPMVCQPGAKSCAPDGAGTQVCAPDGLSQSVATCPVGETCVADGCHAVVCVDGKALCKDSETPATCSAKGTKIETKPPCAADQACKDGACVPKVCKPGAIQCAGLKVLQTCNSSGIAWVDTDCPAASACDGGICKSQTCNPGAVQCKGSELQTCDTKGLGWGTSKDCAASSEVCTLSGCQKPICKAGAKACVNGNPATCGMDGLSWSESKCGKDTACVSGACLDVICAPAAKQCGGDKVEICDPTGTAWVGGADCAASGEVCDKGACQKPICAKGDAKCQGNEVWTCKGPIDGWDKKDCGTGALCVAASCKALVCKPGTTRCEGTKVLTCGADGTAEAESSDCKASAKLCSNGACVPPLCQPGQTSCTADAKLQTCAVGQLGWDVTSCPQGQTCAGTACKVVQCQANSVVCVGAKVQKCSADGTSASTVEDCAATAKVCDQGACKAPICKVGQTQCSVDAKLQTCAPSQLGWDVTSCPQGQTCAGTGCKVVQCQANSVVCVGSKVQKCSADGTSASTVEDCAATAELCDQGACKAPICKVGQTQCSADAKLQICASSLLAWDTKACGSGDTCANGACQKVICTAGKDLCVGQEVHACNATGTATSKKVACASGELCANAQCVKVLCKPKETVCVGKGQVETCADDGMSWASSTCKFGEACWEGACYAQACTPNTKFCVGTTATGCHASGGWFVEIAKCGAQGQGCANGACVNAVCKPGDKSCQGAAVGTCKADATSWELSPCSDGNACTADTCDKATCVFGPPKVCDDKNPCTADTCDTKTGNCLADPKSGACDDGSKCTSGDACLGGVCTATPGGVVTTLAGSGVAGYQDGVASSARFKFPAALLLDPDGKTLWVADEGNHRLRTIDANGTIATVAGSGATGLGSGPASSAAIGGPHGLVWGGDGALYVTAGAGHGILRLDVGAKTVSVLAGSTSYGSSDGQGSAARFANPRGLAWHPGAQSLVVVDQGNYRLRLVTLSGVVTTLAGSVAGSVDGTGAAARFQLPLEVTVDAQGLIWVADTGAHRIRTCTLSGEVKTVFGGAAKDVDGSLAMAQIQGPRSVLSAPGVLWMTSDKRIRALVGGEVFTVAGSEPGYLDGPGSQAKVNAPDGLVLLRDGTIAFADTVNHRIRRISPTLIACDDGQPCTADVCDAATGACTYKALAAGKPCSDGNLCTTDDACDAAGGCKGKATVCDDNNGCTADSCDLGTGKCVFANTTELCDDGDKCSAHDRCQGGACKAGSDQVGTFAGSGTAGDVDGKGVAASFQGPGAIAIGPDGATWVIDVTSRNLRRIAADGTVTTVIPNGGSYVDGPAGKARLVAPDAVAVDASGKVWIGDSGQPRLRRLDRAHVVTTVAGSGTSGYVDGAGSSAKFATLRGLAVRGDGAVVVSDTSNQRIRLVQVDGTVSTLAGSGVAGYLDGSGSSAKFYDPIAVDAHGDEVFVAEYSGRRIRRVQGGVVTTLAGTGAAGSQDGAASSATFSAPSAIERGPDGRLWIADIGIHRVRVLDAKGQVSTVAGSSTYGFVEGDALSARLYGPRALALRPDGTLLIADMSNRRIRTLAPSSVPCEDGDACGVDSCDAKTGACLHKPQGQGGACDDGDACTASSACGAQGTCGGVTKGCEDGNSCTLDVCNSHTGTCEHPAPAAPCDDGDACTTAELCYGEGCNAALATVTAVLGKKGIAGGLDGDATVATLSTASLLVDAKGGVLLSGSHRLRRYDPSTGAVTTLVGSSGQAGSTDGPGATALLHTPEGMALQGEAVWIATSGDHRIRRYVQGKVETVAGTTAGITDGPSAIARFSYPKDIAIGVAGVAFVADYSNHRIRRIDPWGVVTTLAGATAGYVDGPAAAARFNGPKEVELDTQGSVYVVDAGNMRLRKVAANGDVSTVAGNGVAAIVDGVGGSSSLGAVAGLTMLPDGRLWFGDRVSGSSVVRELAAGKITTLSGGADGFYGGALPDAAWYVVTGLASGAGGAVWAIDTNYVLRHIAGGPTLCADGNPCTADACSKTTGACTFTPVGAGTSCTDGNACTLTDACADGVCKGSAKDCGDGKVCTDDRCDPVSGACDHPGNTALCDDGKACTLGERCWQGTCTVSQGLVTTLAGNTGKLGALDGVGAQAAFWSVEGVAWDGAQVWVTDAGAHRIATVSPLGVVTTVVAGGAARKDGPVASAATKTPVAICAGKRGVFWLDEGSRALRWLRGGQVVTVAGSSLAGYVDGVGAAARFGDGTRGIACDDAGGRVVIPDKGNQRIRAALTTGKVVTLAGSGVAGYQDGPGSSAKFSNPVAAALLPDGGVVIADAGNGRLRRVAADGTVTTVAGAGSGYLDGAASSALFGTMQSLAADGAGRIFVGEPYRVRRVASGQVSTLAGAAGAGTTDGPASSATFAMLSGLAVGPMGHIVVADSRTVRQVAQLSNDCDDGDPCTTGSCTEPGGCVQAPAGGSAACVGDLCAVGATCSGATCGGGAPVACDDAMSCTTDACDAKTGACTHVWQPGCTKDWPFADSKVLSLDDIVLLTWLPPFTKLAARCFQQSVDGASAAVFHSKCDAKGASLVVAKLANGTRVAAWTTEAWGGSSAYKAAPGAWLANLSAGQRFDVVNTTYASYTSGTYGPTYGGGHDLQFYYSGAVAAACSGFGHSYLCPFGSHTHPACKAALCGADTNGGWTAVELEGWVAAP